MTETRLEDLDLPAQLPDWIRKHIELYFSDPEAAHMWDASVAGGEGELPCLLLITTGARSGKRRPLPLIYSRDGDNLVVIASKGGAPEHPAWYRNLQAHPEAEVRVGSAIEQVRARDAEGEERERLWARMAAIYPPYDAYQAAAGDRRIPVVVLEPVHG